jgi:hypothetical protein
MPGKTEPFDRLRTEAALYELLCRYLAEHPGPVRLADEEYQLADEAEMREHGIADWEDVLVLSRVSDGLLVELDLEPMLAVVKPRRKPENASASPEHAA